MTTPKDATSPIPSTTKPLGMVGAGRLASMIWKDGDEQSGWRYRFNVFRTARNRARVSQLFAPADVIHFVKLAQVLAAVIADDGCVTAAERAALKRLANDLDELWERTSNVPEHNTCGCAEVHKSNRMKGCGDGNATNT